MPNPTAGLMAVAISEAVPALITAMSDANARVRVQVTRALGDFDLKQVPPPQQHAARSQQQRPPPRSPYAAPAAGSALSGDSSSEPAAPLAQREIVPQAPRPERPLAANAPPPRVQTCESSGASIP